MSSVQYTKVPDRPATPTEKALVVGCCWILTSSFSLPLPRKSMRQYSLACHIKTKKNPSPGLLDLLLIFEGENMCGWMAVAACAQSGELWSLGHIFSANTAMHRDKWIHQYNLVLS